MQQGMTLAQSARSLLERSNGELVSLGNDLLELTLCGDQTYTL